MPFSITWDDASKTIVTVTVVGEWSIQEFQRMLGELVLLMHTVNHPLYMLVDAQSSGIPPLGIIWQARFAFQRLPGNYMGGVVVTGDEYMLNIVNTVSALYVKPLNRLVACHTLDEARRVIQKWKEEGN
jgi:hypothetical protein